MNPQTSLRSPNRRLYFILAAVPALLSIPLIAMQFTTEVSWSAFDFLVMGTLLLLTGLTCELVIRKAKTRTSRIIASLAVLAIFLLIWAELAVGIFGTAFAGN